MRGQGALPPGMGQPGAPGVSGHGTGQYL